MVTQFARCLMSSGRRITVDAARGMFLGAAVGDSLGWPQELRGGLVGGKKARDGAEPKLEFRPWIRNAGYRAHRYRDPVGAGEYSDDTQMLLATARACSTGNRWLQWLIEIELPTWPLYQRGGGGAVLSAAASWADGRPPWAQRTDTASRSRRNRYIDAGANGVAMRIAPHVLWAENYEELVARVFRDGVTTHGHPRALVGALSYAFVLHYAASRSHILQFGELVGAASRGIVPAEQVAEMLPDRWGDVAAFCKTWEATNQEMETLLDDVRASLDQGALSPPTATLERLGCTNPDINGAGTVTAAGAIYLATRFAARPDGGLLAAAYLRGGDTDTLASMTAAILGSVHGTNWMDNLASQVQDSDYIAGVASTCAERTILTPRPPGIRPVAARKRLRSLLVAGDIADIHEFPDGRSATVRSFEPVDSSVTRRAALQLGDGQVVYIDVDAYMASPPALDSGSPPGTDRNVTGFSAAPELEPVALRQNAIHANERIDSVGVVLPSMNLSRCASFYARLMGENLTVHNRMLRITSWLVLREAERDGVVDTAEITLTSVDLESLVGRLQLDPVLRQGNTVVVRDPDGRTVRIAEVQRT